MAIVISPVAEVTLLDVGWPVYAALLAESGNHGFARLAYTGAVLEIASPSPKHEVYNRLLEALVREAARVWNIELLGVGSATLRMQPYGAEADSSFYVGAQAAPMRNRDAIDLAVDPPPDIVVEIDISRGRVDKVALYAALGVREFWRYDGQRLRACDVRDEARPEIENSLCLAGLPIAELDRFLEMRGGVDHSGLLDLWSRWLREHRPKPS